MKFTRNFISKINANVAVLGENSNSHVVGNTVANGVCKICTNSYVVFIIKLS